MKKLLSLMLVICLILGLVPVSSEGGGEPSPEGGSELPSADWFTVTMPEDHVFDGAERNAEVVLNEGCPDVGIEYGFCDQSGEFDDHPVYPGTYKLCIYVYGVEGYDDAYIVTDDSWVFTVYPNPLTVTGLEVAEKTYDGTTSVAISGKPGLNVNDLLEGYNDVNITGEPAGNFEDANAGEEKLVFLSGLTLEGEDADCYTIDSLTGTIEPRSVKVTAHDEDYTIDEEINLSFRGDELEGAVSGHSLNSLKLTYNGEIAVGAKLPIVPSEAEIVDNAGNDMFDNYVIQYVNGTLTILPRPILREVTFQVVNGSWDDGSKDPVSMGWEGDTLTLPGEIIPVVGTKPAEGYTEGGWDVTPVAGMEITQDTTFTYTYARKKISRKVTFQVVNGSWNNESTDPVIIELEGLEGDTLTLPGD